MTQQFGLRAGARAGDRHVRSDRSRHAVVFTQSGREAYRALFEQSVRWRAYVQTLPSSSADVPLLVEDMFLALYETEVELNPAIAPGLHRNFAAVSALLPMAAFGRLRKETVGDPIAAAGAARSLVEDVLTAVSGEVERGSATARSGRPGRFARAFGKGRDRRRADVNATWRDDVQQPLQSVIRALHDALDGVIQERHIRNMWGIAPGVRSAHALDDVWDLVAVVRSLPGFDELTDAFAELAALLRPAAQGRRRRRRRAEQGTYEALQGLTRGRDVERVVPEEFVRLLDDDMAGLFYEAYEHGRLLQERYGAKPRAGPGPLVVCLDVSRSMNTIAAGGRQRFVWAKGVGLALMDTARRTERPFFAICFSSEHELATFEIGTDGYDPQTAIDLARCDFDGGTHFRKPLRRAIKYLEQQQDDAAAAGPSEPGCIVFITDGEAALPEAFVRGFERDRRRLRFQLITLFIDGRQPELAALSDRVFVVHGDRLQSWEQAAAGLARVVTPL